MSFIACETRQFLQLTEFRVKAAGSYDIYQRCDIKRRVVGHLEGHLSGDDESVALGTLNCNLLECGYNSKNMEIQDLIV